MIVPTTNTEQQMNSSRIGQSSESVQSVESASHSALISRRPHRDGAEPSRGRSRSPRPGRVRADRDACQHRVHAAPGAAPGRAGTPVKVVEPYQMLGEIAPDLLEALGVDVVGLEHTGHVVWLPQRGLEALGVLVTAPRCWCPGKFNTEPDENGDILMYVDGDKALRLSGQDAQGRLLLRLDHPAEPYRGRHVRQRRTAEPARQRRGLRRLISDEDLAYLRARVGPALRADRQGADAGVRRRGVRRYCAGARPLAEAAEGDSRCGGMVHEHGHAQGVRAARCSSASAKSSWPTCRGYSEAVGDRADGGLGERDGLRVAERLLHLSSCVP